MRQFLKVTLSKTFSKNFLIFVFGFVFFELITRTIAKLIHHNADSIHLLIVPSLLIIVIMYTIKYIVECFKYFHNHEGNDASSKEHLTNIGMALNFMSIFCLLLAFLFLNINHPWLFLSLCLIAVVLRIIMFVKDR